MQLLHRVPSLAAFSFFLLDSHRFHSYGRRITTRSGATRRAEGSATRARIRRGRPHAHVCVVDPPACQQDHCAVPPAVPPRRRQCRSSSQPIGVDTRWWTSSARGSTCTEREDDCMGGLEVDRDWMAHLRACVSAPRAGCGERRSERNRAQQHHGQGGTRRTSMQGEGGICVVRIRC